MTLMVNSNEYPCGGPTAFRLQLPVPPVTHRNYINTEIAVGLAVTT